VRCSDRFNFHVSTLPHPQVLSYESYSKERGTETQFKGAGTPREVAEEGGRERRIAKVASNAVGK